MAIVGEVRDRKALLRRLPGPCGARKCSSQGSRNERVTEGLLRSAGIRRCQRVGTVFVDGLSTFGFDDQPMTADSQVFGRQLRAGSFRAAGRSALRVAGALCAVVVATGLALPFGGAGALADGDQHVGDAQSVTLPTDFTPPPGLRQLLPLAGVAFVVPSISAGFCAHIDGLNGPFVPSQPGDELLFLTADAYSFAPPFGQTPYHYAAPQLSVAFGGHSVSFAETPDGSVSGVAGSA